MGTESSAGNRARSNPRGLKYEPKNIGASKDRISFRDLAKFARRRKTEQFLSERTGCDASTAKRWLSGKSRAPADAAFAILSDILARIS